MPPDLLYAIAALAAVDALAVGIYALWARRRARRAFPRMTGIELDVFGCIQQCPRRPDESERKYRKRLAAHVAAGGKYR